MFKITIMSHITCNQCNAARVSNFVNEYSLSLSINGHNISSIQSAINFFEIEELININCNENECQNGYGKRTLQFCHSPKHLIIHLKRFIVTHNGSMKINKKILLNDRISINNVDVGQQQHYSLISFESFRRINQSWSLYMQLFNQ